MWIILVLLLLIIAFIFFSFASASTDGSLWGRTARHVRVTFSKLGESFGFAPIAIDKNGTELGEGTEVEAGEGKITTELPDLPPPLEEGQAVINDSIVARLLSGRGIFVVNTHMRANGNLQVSGSTMLADVNVAELARLAELSVAGPTEMAGLLSALGGIRTGGANIDLEGGQLLGVDYIAGINAGENVVISGPANNPTISVPDIRRFDEGVRTVNGQKGDVRLLAGNDIAINGLTIANTSTLASVRNRGGCVGCLLDSDVADDLTIVDGRIDDTEIGGITPAKAYFTNVAIDPGPGSTGNSLTVSGDAVFTGTVRGLPATENDEFVTLQQVAHLLSGGGYTGVTHLNSLYGAVTLAGTAGQVNVATAGSTITLSLPQAIGLTDSPTFASLNLTGGLTVGGNVNVVGTVTAGSFVSADATMRKSGEELLRASISIFPYALPADTGSTSFRTISKDFNATNNPISTPPPAIAGTTRAHRLMIKYADSVPTASIVTWRVYRSSDNTTIATFTTPGLNKNVDDLEDFEVFITTPVTLPATDWRVEVRVPSGRVRVADIHMLAFDVID